MKNLDYDRLLDDWADLVFKEMDEAKAILKNEPFGTPRFYGAKGYEDGLSMAMAILGTLEKRKRKKYEIIDQNETTKDEKECREIIEEYGLTLEYVPDKRIKITFEDGNHKTYTDWRELNHDLSEAFVLYD
ncbi:hypothetical protein IFU39_00135 [Paenibacillus sp. CFBP 13594]|uniref:hypothetical protein n=1 Tax=Paenibacillus sp. CFBP 13594 TaxID=2774037 RepID=UPI001782AE05|nr:hypothetical protein [Paenibacillus sp. CFBP 13594]MBD8836226.1 hypothetical protein [Paenibacillus sp. CFBP 13594]